MGIVTLVSLIPLALTLYFVDLAGRVLDGEHISASYAWVDSLDANLDFSLDGLSLVFVLLICGIGALVFIYAGGYLKGHPQLGRFYLYITLFMFSMVGVVAADNVILLFVFWELTSLTSFLLIGFNHTATASQNAARQAFIVTAAGGLALLAGLVLLGIITDTWTLSAYAEQAAFIQDHEFYLPILILILLGAFSKSAQFPFHFWLPGAMEAPTPVSAYLHSATMVKAGIYLLARLSPSLGGSDAWTILVTGVGGITMLMGGYIAWQQTDLKRILAYTTIGALGIITFLLGIGSGLAVKAAILFIVTHALYKAALFMVAGAIDHETGTRDIQQLGGLGRLMPFSALAAAVAALSMAGLPPLLGFIAKEVIYEATQEAENIPVILLTVAAIVGNLFNVAAAGMVAWRPFWGTAVEFVKTPHEAPLMMWIGPVILGIGSVAAGLFSHQLVEPLLEEAVAATYGAPYKVKLGLWHGFNLSLLLSVITVAGGVAFFLLIERLRPLGASAARVTDPIGPQRLYDGLMSGVVGVGELQNSLIFRTYLRYYIRIIMITASIALIGVMALEADFSSITLSPDTPRYFELGVAGLIIAAAIAVTFIPRRLAAVAALGVVGYGVAVIFIMFGAPDLAMTQFAIETLTVVLFVLAIYRLPRFKPLSERGTRLRDAVIAITAGGIMTTLVLIITSSEPPDLRVTRFFARMSYLQAKGQNVVNVILVDFRGIDTMGEITVLSIAAIGVYALLKLNLSDSEDSNPSAENRKPMRSLVLQTATRYLIPLMLMFSVFLLLAGHNAPGGGFVGGLLAAAAFSLYAIAHGFDTARDTLRIPPRRLIGGGLLLALGSGLFSIALDYPFMTGQWDDTLLPAIGKLGTPVLFDTGVYLVVIGVTLLVVFSLAEVED